jgi:gamma-glutamyl-gamma-aminobutyrate hydrolase PuuD
MEPITKKCISKIEDKIHEVDLISDTGDSLVDSLILWPSFSQTMLKKTKDPLFYLLEADADLSLPKGKTNIAISHCEGIWSTGIWAFARVARTIHPNVEFYLVKPEVFTKDDYAIVNSFHGWINPGAGDSYPKGKTEFDLSDYKPAYPIEEYYQSVLQKTSELGIPYLGICAGSQHLALYHQGILKPVEGYDKGQQSITFLKGSLIHFFSLTKEQQAEALKTKVLPEVSFMADTAHHYAAVTGSNMQLGAVSEHGIYMGYSRGETRFGYQFHPEHAYVQAHSQDAAHQHQQALLDNWISLCVMHKKGALEDYKKQIGEFLEEYNASSHDGYEAHCLGED